VKGNCHEKTVELLHLLLMEFRQLGNSGLKVLVLSFGTGTFGGKGEFFAALAFLLRTHPVSK